LTAFIFIKGVVASIDEVFDGPFPAPVLETSVNGSVTNERIAIDGHKMNFDKKKKKKLTVQIDCTHAF
jgi:hypothetical protein